MDASESSHAAAQSEQPNDQLSAQSAVRARLEHIHGAARVEDRLAQAGEEGDLLHRALLGVRLTEQKVNTYHTYDITHTKICRSADEVIIGSERTER